MQTKFTKNQARLEELKHRSADSENQAIPSSYFEKNNDVSSIKEGENVDQYKSRLSDNLNVLLRQIQKKQNEFENIFALSGIIAPEAQLDIEKLMASNITASIKLDNSNVLSLLKD